MVLQEWWETSSPMWHRKLYDSTECLKLDLDTKEKKKYKCFYVNFLKKKINQPVPFCFSSKGNLELQTRAYPLLCILQLLYSFYWCSLNLSLRLTTWICTNTRRSYVSHGPRSVFCHAKEKRKKKSSASVKLFRVFFFFPDQWHYYCTTVNASGHWQAMGCGWLTCRQANFCPASRRPALLNCKKKKKKRTNNNCQA